MEKKKTRIRRKNAGIKKVVFLLILLFIIIQIFFKLILPGVTTLSRYVSSAVRKWYLSSKSFYFSSDKLSETTAYFESDNWSGIDEYAITINMNSTDNAIEFSSVDIDYDIEYEYKVCHSNGSEYPKDTVEFYITGLEYLNGENQAISRTIMRDANNSDNFTFSVKPKTNVTLETDDYVWVKIKTTSTSPYVSKLEGEFKIKIGKLGMSYIIDDKSYQSYFELRVTNTLDYYIVDEAFGAYANGSHISIEDYLKLNDANKEKCHSMIITVGFNPNIALLDTTSSIYLQDNVGEIEYENITNGNNTFKYAKKISFKIDAEESKVVKFYKKDVTKDYTYPGTEDSSITISYI